MLIGKIALQTQIENPDQFNNYLILGYALLGLIAFAYIFYLANRYHNLRHDLTLLEQLLDENGMNGEQK